MLKYNGYHLIIPNSSQKTQISQVIEKCNGSIFQDVTFNEIISSHFETELFYLVDNPNNISSFSPVHVEKIKYGMNIYHFCPEIDIPYAGFVGGNELIYNDFSTGLFESIIYKGFPYEKEINIKSVNVKIGETSMVDLNEDDIFDNVIQSRRRNMIRKAIKHDINIKSFTDTQGLNEFWPILEQLHIKLGYSSLTYDYYNDIITEFGPKKEAFILIAYRDNKAISGVLIVGNQNYMHYYKGASLHDAGNCGHSELLHWESIKLSKFLGCKYYDLCNLNKNELPEIYQFKTGISKDIYQYPYFYNSSFPLKIVNRIKKIFK